MQRRIGDRYGGGQEVVDRRNKKEFMAKYINRLVSRETNKETRTQVAEEIESNKRKRREKRKWGKRKNTRKDKQEWKKQDRKEETEEGGSERKQSSGGQTGRNEVKLGERVSVWEQRRRKSKRKSRIDVGPSEGE